MDAEIKNALSGILCDVERRCKDMVCSVPDDISSARSQLWMIKEIIDNSIMAIDNPPSETNLNKVLEWIKQERLREYENKDTDREREEAQQSR